MCCSAKCATSLTGSHNLEMVHRHDLLDDSPPDPKYIGGLWVVVHSFPEHGWCWSLFEAADAAWNGPFSDQADAFGDAWAVLRAQ
jgi:hypothetical protein